MERPAMAYGIETEYSIYPMWHLAQKPRSGGTSYRDAVLAMVRAASSMPQIMGPQMIRTFGDNAFSDFLHNGARFYEDMQAPEYCTPECPDPYWLVVHDQAGMLIEQMMAEKAAEELGCPIELHKKNSDGMGHAYGCHENFTISPVLFEELTKFPYKEAQAVFATFAIVRTILTGAGKVGVEAQGYDGVFQFCQRADYVTDFLHTSTTSNRPLIQVREEPHANKNKWQRLHYIMGDANMSQVSTYLKTGLTGLLLMLLQDYERFSYRLPTFEVELDVFPKLAKIVSWDMKFAARPPVFMVQRGRADQGGNMPVLDILACYLDRLGDYVEERPFNSVREKEIYADVVRRSVEYLKLIKEGRSEELYGVLDWATKQGILNHYLKKRGKTWAQAKDDVALRRRLRSIADHAYTSLDQENGLYWQLLRAGDIKRIVKDSEISKAVLQPPPGRAELRTALTDLLLNDIEPMGVNWSYIKVPHPKKPGEVWTIKLQDPMLMVSGLMKEIIANTHNVSDLDRQLKELVRKQSEGGGNA